MAKHVVVIASGETERRSLPHLLAHLRNEGIIIDEVRCPSRNRALTVEIAESLMKATWFASISKPDKFVILIDADGKPGEDLLRPFRDNLRGRLAAIPAALQFAFAQWHLEAWFFGDVSNLRKNLGRDLGSIDASKPDEVNNPKHHLKQLLGESVYTAVISEKIARTTNPVIVEGRSPSFRAFVEAVRNGDSAPAA